MRLDLQFFGGRGASSSGAAGNGAGTNTTLSDAQMQKELDAHFEKVNDVLDRFMKSNGKQDLDEMDSSLDLSHIEKHTLADIKKTYIDDFNQNVKNYGDGFEFYDPDQTMSILYKDGHTEIISPDNWDGGKRIPTSNIDSVIVDSGWGTAVAGKNVRLYNMRQEVDYGKYGYKSLKARYDDWDDIRAEFK